MTSSTTITARFSTAMKARIFGLGVAATLGAFAPSAQAGFTITASYNLGTSTAVGATDVPPGPCGSTTAGADALLFTGLAL